MKNLNTTAKKLMFIYYQNWCADNNHIPEENKLCTFIEKDLYSIWIKNFTFVEPVKFIPVFLPFTINEGERLFLITYLRLIPYLFKDHRDQ